MSNESEMIKQYLKKMSKKLFLSKKEEQIIGRRIGVVKKQILDKCLESPIFLAELRNLCLSAEKNANNVIKYSKHLIEDSPKSDKLRIQKHFMEIKVLIEQVPYTRQDAILLDKLVSYVDISSSTLSQLTLGLKQKYETIKSYKTQTDNIYKFLEVKDDIEYNELAIKCQDQKFIKVLAKDLYCDSPTLLKKLRQQEDIYRFLNKEGFTHERISDLFNLVDSIKDLEENYKKDREQLIIANLPLVVSRAKRFNFENMNLEDLIQEGNVGLIKAVDKYDPEKNVKITTYATWWIDQAIRRGISNKSKLVRIPIHIQQNTKLMNQAFFILSQQLLRDPTLSEISKYTEIPMEQIEMLNMAALYEVCIDGEISQGLTYADILFDKEQKTPFASTAKTMLKNKIRIAISDLSPRSQKIIMLRYGIGMPREHTLEEIGTQFSVTKERIRQIQAKAVRNLKTNNKIPIGD